jgi:hypothetical protein
MFLKWQNGRWLRAPEDKGGSSSGSSDENKDKGGESELDPKAIIEENKRLKAELTGLSPKLQKLEDAEAKREAAAKKADEDKRKKELGAEKVLEEKDRELKTVADRLASYEKREQGRVDALFAKLPEQAQAAIESFRGKLSLEDWSDLVEKQGGLVSVDEPDGDDKVSMFLKPGGASKRDGHEPSAMTKKILEDIGMGDTMTGKMVVKREVDSESGQRLTKFTRHVKHFFGDMNRATAFKLGSKQ